MSLFTSLRPAFFQSRTSDAGSTAEGAPTRLPAYNIVEADENYLLTIDMPGVNKEDLTVTAEDGVLSVTGKYTWQQPEGWTPLHLESAGTGYALALSYEDAIEAEKISAAFTDGVLRLTLPKSEARKPRKITVS
jgi:HSP20 family molecular chaperone IbpA